MRSVHIPRNQFAEVEVGTTDILHVVAVAVVAAEVGKHRIVGSDR